MKNLRLIVGSTIGGIVGSLAMYVFIAWASQTYVLPTSGTDHGTEHLTNIPNRDEALRSLFSAATAPTSPTPVEGQPWYETDTDLLHIYYNGASWYDVVFAQLANTFTGNPQIISNAANPTLRVTDTTNTVSGDLVSTDTQAQVGTSSNHPACVMTNGNCRSTWDTSGNQTTAGGELRTTNGDDHTATAACTAATTRVGLWCYANSGTNWTLRNTSTDDAAPVNVNTVTGAKAVMIKVDVSAQDAGSTTTVVSSCAGDPATFTGCSVNAAEITRMGASAKGLGTAAYAMGSVMLVMRTNASGQIATECQIDIGIDEGQCFWSLVAYLD